MKLAGCGITKHYGGVTALDGLSVEIHPGEVRSLMGENGAGKSTLARILSGCETPDGGHVELDGERIAIDGPLHAQKLGIAIIHQELDLFPALTVGENIVIGNLHFPESLRVDRADRRISLLGRGQSGIARYRERRARALVGAATVCLFRRYWPPPRRRSDPPRRVRAVGRCAGRLSPAV